MAEWALLIMVFVVVGGAYAFSRQVFETWQVMAVWVGAGLIITIGLIIYISNKAQVTAKPWVDQYQIDEP